MKQNICEKDFAEIFAKRPQVIKPGLQRMERAITALGLPIDSCPPAILVAGTNGKGSTSGFLFRFLEAAGIKTGLFTSPHMQFFRERFNITDQEVTDQNLLYELNELKAHLPHSIYDELSFFEVNTLMALQLFQRHAVQAIVFEVGLGGRWDATNIISPSVSVITSIGLDHQEFLGNNLQSIAREKAGIMRAGRPCLWGGNLASQDPEEERLITEVLEQVAGEKGASLLSYGTDFHESDWDLSNQSQFGELPDYLQRNFVLARAAFESFYHQEQQTCFEAYQDVSDLPPVTLSQQSLQIRQLASLRGRFEILPEHHLLVDVCHNPAAARALRQSFELRWEGRRVPILISIFRDKDIAGIIRELSPIASQFVCYQNQGERSWQRSDFESLLLSPAIWFDTLPLAWKHLQSLINIGAQDFDIHAVACGSVHATGELLTVLSSLS